MRTDARYDVLRRALDARGRVSVRVSLARGPCWVSAVAMSRSARGEPRVSIAIAGATLKVPLSRVTEIDG